MRGEGRHANPMGMAFTTLELEINFMKPVWTGKLRAAAGR